MRPPHTFILGTDKIHRALKSRSVIDVRDERPINYVTKCDRKKRKRFKDRTLHVRIYRYSYITYSLIRLFAYYFNFGSRKCMKPFRSDLYRVRNKTKKRICFHSSRNVDVYLLKSVLFLLSVSRTTRDRSIDARSAHALPDVSLSSIGPCCFHLFL